MKEVEMKKAMETVMKKEKGKIRKVNQKKKIKNQKIRKRKEKKR